MSKEMTHTTQQTNHAVAAVLIFVSVFVFVTWSHSHWCCNRSRTQDNQNHQIIRPYSYSCPGFVRIRAPAERTTMNTTNQHNNQQQGRGRIRIRAPAEHTTINTNNQQISPWPYSYSCPVHIRIRALDKQTTINTNNQRLSHGHICIRAPAVFVFMSG